MKVALAASRILDLHQRSHARRAYDDLHPPQIERHAMTHTNQEESVGSIQSSSHCGRVLHSGEALAKLDDTLRSVRAQLGELQGTSLRRAREAIRAADESVHHHPYGALAAVVVTGLLVGFLAGRR